MGSKKALVTGASSGLGYYVARRLQTEGWSVIGTASSPIEKLPADRGFDYVQADLGQPDSLVVLPDRIGGRPNLIVHCAALYPVYNECKPTLEELERIVRINALVPYLLTLNLLALDRGGSGNFCSCVMVNSEAIFHADYRSSPFAASKAALRVLTSGLADACRSRNASVSTLLLGPLADKRKADELQTLAEKRGLDQEGLTRLFLRKSNPNLVIDQFIDYDPCYRSIEYLASLGQAANGMMCRLDGGSAGSLL